MKSYNIYVHVSAFHFLCSCVKFSSSTKKILVGSRWYDTHLKILYRFNYDIFYTVLYFPKWGKNRFKELI